MKTKSVTKRDVEFENEYIDCFVDDSFDITERILYLLKDRGLTQKELAELLGKKNTSEISKWLSGNHNFTIATLTKLRVALKSRLFNVCSPKLYEIENTEWGKPNLNVLSDDKQLIDKNIQTSMCSEIKMIPMCKFAKVNNCKYG